MAVPEHCSSHRKNVGKNYLRVWLAVKKDALNIFAYLGWWHPQNGLFLLVTLSKLGIIPMCIE